MEEKTIFDIAKVSDVGCDFFLKKIIGFLVVKVERENYKTDSEKYFIHTIPLSMDDYDASCNVDLEEKDEIVGLLPVDDSYEVFGLRDGEENYESLGYIFGKASCVLRDHWERKLKKEENTT